MVSIVSHLVAGATDLMVLFLVLSGAAGLIVIVAGGLFVASFSISGTSATIDAGLAILACVLRNVWMTCMPRMLAVYSGIGGGAAFLVGALVIIRSDEAAETCAPALIGALIGGIAVAGSVLAWTKLHQLGEENIPRLISLYNGLAGFAIVLEAVAIRSTWLMIAGLIIGTARVLMTVCMVHVQPQILTGAHAAKVGIA
jgi:NAD/NADP transhydrogenase beta subunit